MCLSFLINFRTRGPHTLLFSKLSPCLSKDKFHPLRYLLTSDNLSKCFLPFVQMSHQSSHVIDSNRLAIYSDNCIVCQVTRPLTLKIAFLKYILNFFLILFLTYKLRKYCFGDKFSKWRFWWIYTFWEPLNPKITFLAFGLCVCVCYQHNSKTDCSRIFKFSILHLYHR